MCNYKKTIAKTNFKYFFQSKVAILSKPFGYLSLVFPLAFISDSAFSAYSATTIKSIQGSSPRFIDSGDSAINLADFKYFGVKFDDIEYFDPKTLSIALDSSGYKIATVKPNDLLTTSTVSGKFTLALGTPTSEEVINVANGTELVLPVPLTKKSNNSVSMKWYYDSNGTETALSSAELSKTFCQLAQVNINPYIKITGDIDLNIKYGDPRSQSYPAPALGLTVTPNRSFPIELNGGICGAQPSMYSSGGKYIAPNSGTIWAGSTVGGVDFGSLGNGLGFLPQSNGVNFPTLGADNLFFNLIVAGTDTDSLSWFVNDSPNQATVNGVTVTVVGNQSSSKAKVTLNGPKAVNDKAPIFSPGGRNFIVTAKNNEGKVIINYPFTINNWFIYKGLDIATASVQATWCSGLAGTGNYGLPLTRNLTNDNAFDKGATPYSTSKGNMQRLIGAGFFSEWGDVRIYTDTGFNSSNTTVWTSQEHISNGVTNQLGVSGATGASYSLVKNNRTVTALCIANPQSE